MRLLCGYLWRGMWLNISPFFRGLYLIKIVLVLNLLLGRSLIGFITFNGWTFLHIFDGADFNASMHCVQPTLNIIFSEHSRL